MLGLRYGSMGAPRPSSSVNFKDNKDQPPSTPGGETNEGGVKKGSSKKGASPKQVTPAGSVKGTGLAIRFYLFYHHLIIYLPPIISSNLHLTHRYLTPYLPFLDRHSSRVTSTVCWCIKIRRQKRCFPLHPHPPSRRR